MRCLSKRLLVEAGKILAVAVAIMVIGAVAATAWRSVSSRYIFMHVKDAPGYTFISDGITYQIRPIKARMTIFVGKDADSAYQSMMQIDTFSR